MATESDSTSDPALDEKRALVPTSPGRSRNLAAIRRTNTKPEVAVRSALHRRGHRFRKDLRIDLADGRVRPDIVFTRTKVAIFIDGCFWHVCPLHGREPTSNEWYWTPKLRKNVARDEKANNLLTSSGWTVVRIWEHESLANAIESIEATLRNAGT
ncbi:very short patch repair endonuclease [Kineosporia sp. J2-2]|uniref:Very short patch repair endonuclease n=1 Tax=Kineosporia corallincola TaxID=2835133 RepID=A0ABS5TI50_9ACTN|nr:very short patch repair endonuclease [Kineosporia corallincola]